MEWRDAERVARCLLPECTCIFRCNGGRLCVDCRPPLWPEAPAAAETAAARAVGDSISCGHANNFAMFSSTHKHSKNSQGNKRFDHVRKMSTAWLLVSVRTPFRLARRVLIEHAWKDGGMITGLGVSDMPLLTCSCSRCDGCAGELETPSTLKPITFRRGVGLLPMLSLRRLRSIYGKASIVPGFK